MVLQVPSSTYFQALACLSVFDVPAQVVPGPAAQSFFPAMATPKHFSWGILAAWALKAAPAVNPAKAMAASVEVANLDMSLPFKSERPYNKSPTLLFVKDYQRLQIVCFFTILF
jgi:hypothetical protein